MMASFTVEATLAFTLFFFTVYIFWQCFFLVLYEMRVADKVGEACVKMEKYGYAERKLAAEDAEYMAIMYLPVLYQCVDSIENIGNKIILCTNNDEGTVRISVSYEFRCTAPLIRTVTIPVKQVFETYPFIGIYDADKLAEDESEEDESEKYYITKSGSVYHMSKNCTYLRMNVTACDENLVMTKRNNDGCKYYECTKCNDGKHSGQVYITEYGDRYHYSLSCTGIHRDYIETDKEGVAGRKPCSKCGKKEN